MSLLVSSIPKEGWEHRKDPESYETCVVREDSKFFPTTALDVIETVAPKHFGEGFANRLVFSCVPAGKKILPHTDDFGKAVQNSSWHCHIPLVTSLDVVMGIDDKEVHMLTGHLYVMDETCKHYVNNPSSIDRIHLLFAWFPHYGKQPLKAGGRESPSPN